MSNLSLNVKNLDLHVLCRNIRQLTFDPGCFTAASLRLSVSWMGAARAATGLVFSSGEVVILARAEKECLVLGHALVRLLTTRGGVPNATLANFRVRNRVISTVLPEGVIPAGYVEFRDFAAKLVGNPHILATFQDQLFPGIVIRPVEQSRVSCTLFSSGSVVVSGALTAELAGVAIGKLCEAIKVAKESPNHEVISQFFQYALSAAIKNQVAEAP